MVALPPFGQSPSDTRCGALAFQHGAQPARTFRSARYFGRMLRCPANTPMPEPGSKAGPLLRGTPTVSRQPGAKTPIGNAAAVALRHRCHLHHYRRRWRRYLDVRCRWRHHDIGPNTISVLASRSIELAEPAEMRPEVVFVLLPPGSCGRRVPGGGWTTFPEVEGCLYRNTIRSAFVQPGVTAVARRCARSRSGKTNAPSAQTMITIAMATAGWRDRRAAATVVSPATEN